MKSTGRQTTRSDLAAIKGRMQFELSRILDEIFERPGFNAQLYLPLEKTRALALFRTLIYRAIDEPRTDLAAGQKALADGIAALELRASLPHGVIGKVYNELPLSPEARATLIRESNRLAELPKGWLGFRGGGPQRKVEVSDVRHNSELRKVLASGSIFTDMDICGSEKAFRAEFCPGTTREETPKAKCLRSLGNMKRWSEELDPQDLPEVHERLAEVCMALGFVPAAALKQAKGAKVTGNGTKSPSGRRTIATKSGPNGEIANNPHVNGGSGGRPIVSCRDHGRAETAPAVSAPSMAVKENGNGDK